MKVQPSLLLVIGLMVQCGCSSESTDSAAQPAEQPDTGAASYRVEFSLPANVASNLLDSDRPTSIDSFVAEFVRRFEKDMYSPFIDLAYWGDASDDEKREYLEYVKATFTTPSENKRATIKSPTSDIELHTVAEYGDAAYFPRDDDTVPAQGPAGLRRLVPSPTHIMGVTAHFNEYVSVTDYFAVGEQDGVFYFSTIAAE